jgi:hypothetical protein
MYRPEQWQDFFVMVGGGSAALTGLVFVAMSLNLEPITRDATHRYRAIGTLAGFAAAFVICALALMGGQNRVAIGLEWFGIATIAGVVYVRGYVLAVRRGGSPAGLHGGRLIAGTTCYAAQMVGALVLVLGYSVGLYVASVAMVVYFPFMISGAWLLIVGIYQEPQDE